MTSTNEKMNKTIKDLKVKISGLRTNRANPDMIKNIQVNYYGSYVPVEQLASITTPDPSLFLLNVFDQGSIKDIEKAITQSSLGLTPQTEGSSIRIILPELTQERRANLIKVLKQTGEDSKIAIRHIRRDEMETIKKQEKNKELTEDESKSEQENTQKQTDHFITTIDNLVKDKEKELEKI